MRNGKNPYQVLGVAMNADKAEIKAAYRRLASKYQVSNYQDNPLADLAQEKLDEINEAYDELMGANNYSKTANEKSSYQAEDNYRSNNRQQFNQQQYQAADPCTGRPYQQQDYGYNMNRAYGQRSCCTDLSLLCCLDSCCECMGGDLCTCC